MPKIKRNEQFVKIEKKICTYLLEQKKSPSKEPIHFDEFKDLKELTRQLATEKGMSLSEWFRWLNYRYLSVHGYLPIEIEKRKIEYLSDEDLEINKTTIMYHNKSKSNTSCQQKGIENGNIS
jgi:hypothetical protein